MMLGFANRLTPLERRSRALAGGRKSTNFRAKFEIRFAGMRLFAKGSPDVGSRMFLHLLDLGLTAQKGESAANIPVPLESSARFPWNCARDGKRPVSVCPLRFLSPS